MSLRYIVVFLCVTMLIISCGDTKPKKTKLAIQTNTTNIKLGDTLNLSLKNPKNITIDSVKYMLNGKAIAANEILNKVTLGKKQLTATAYFKGTSEALATQITIYNNKKPELYTFDIVNTFPHDNTSYTQGLEFFNDELYESTGQRGQSKLIKVDYKTGKVLKNLNLNDNYFGEGLTILNGKIYQLTWEAETGFVYDLESFEKLSSFKYGNSKQGWGLCNDGKILYKTDGSEKIWKLNSETLVEEGYIQVYTQKASINNLNELEWVNGEIYANMYTKKGIAIINPNTGALNGVIDLSPLSDMVTVNDPKQEVLNGIAYHAERNTFFVTGKNWDKLFEVTFRKK